MEFYILGALILGGFIGINIGYSQGVKDGAAGMYDQLYEKGVRKGDNVIVKLEYEPRNISKEF